MAAHAMDWQVVSRLGRRRALVRHETYEPNSRTEPDRTARWKWAKMISSIIHVALKLRMRWVYFIENYAGISSTLPRPVTMAFLGMDHIDRRRSLIFEMIPPPALFPDNESITALFPEEKSRPPGPVVDT